MSAFIWKTINIHGKFSNIEGRVGWGVFGHARPPPPRHHTGVIRRDPSVCSAGHDPNSYQSSLVNERPLREFFNNQLVSFSDFRHFSIYTVDILQEVVIIVLDVELHVIPVVHWKRKTQFWNSISRYNGRSPQHNVNIFHYWGSVYNYSVLFLLWNTSLLRSIRH